MSREPGKRDYGTSDCAALRNLASRGVNLPPPAAAPQPIHPARARHEKRHDTTRDPRDTHVPA